VYARPTIDGQLLDFGVSGKLIMNALVMYDRQTDSLWSQILGRAVDGPLKGTALQPLPSIMTTWAQWRDLHPDTVALVTGGMAYDPYDGYYESGSAGILGETRSDDRLESKALVTGAVIGGQPVVYPWAVLADERVANDTVAGTPVLVVHDPATSTTLLFERTVDGKVLTFHWDTGEETQFVLVDEETGSQWTAWNGAGVEGPHAGRTLQRVPATSAFWFGWKDFYPDTLVYGVDG